MKFDELKSIFDRLTVLSIKELQNEELTFDDYSFLHHVGKEFQLLATFNYAEDDTSVDEADKRTALIADVFTESNSEQVLEVAVGNPFLIYVIIQDHTGDLYLTRGVTFSYYQFLMPSNQRMTDEEWITLLDTAPPDYPEWISSNLPISENEVIIIDYNPKVMVYNRKK